MPNMGTRLEDPNPTPVASSGLPAGTPTAGPSPTAAPGYGGGATYGAAPAPAWDNNPLDGFTQYTGRGPDFIETSDLETGGRYQGTSWELTPEQVQRAQHGVNENGMEEWYPAREDFMYGRNPLAAEADIARARGQGQYAADTAQAWGAAGSDFAQTQARALTGMGASALSSGQVQAENVANAGQQVMQTGEGLANQQRAVGQLQGSAGVQYGGQIANQGQAIQNNLTSTAAGLGTGIQGTARGVQNIGSAYGSSLKDVAGRGIATAETRAGEMTAAGQRYANDLSGLERTEGPSGAQGLLNQQNNRAMSNQLALARSGRGMGGSAAAMSQAAQNIGALQQDAGNQAAQLRAQENAAWRGRQASNIANAAGINIGAQNNAQTAVNNAYGVGSNALASGGGLALGGAQANLAGQTNAANLAYQGASQGAQMAQQGQIAGAQMGMQGLDAMGRNYAQGAATQMQGAEANAAAAAQAASVSQGAYAQGLQGYGMAADTGLAGYQYGSDTTMAGLEQQKGYEDYARSIRALEMQGGQALEDKLIRDYAIRTGQQTADRQADREAEAGRLNFYAQGAGDTFQAWQNSGG